MEVTPREVLVSIVIVCVLLVVGIVISGNINDAVMGQCQEYDTALQINNDRDLFEYGMRTNIGNAFVYGRLKAVDPVTYPEIGGSYSYVKKVKERYTRHTRTVTKTKTVNGKTKTYTDTEVYWTWDAVASWFKHSEKISFLDVEFDYGKIDFPLANHIATKKESSNIRYVYYGAGDDFTGTLYTVLNNNTISNSIFHNSCSVDAAIENMKSAAVSRLIVFWVLWSMLIVGCVFGFLYLDNYWLE